MYYRSRMGPPKTTAQRRGYGLLPRVTLVFFLWVPIAMAYQLPSENETERSSILRGPRTIATGITTDVPFEAEFEDVRVEKADEGLPRKDVVRGTIRRDGQGRVRTEYRLEIDHPRVTNAVAIFDPVSRAIFVLDPSSKTVSRTPLPAQEPGREEKRSG